MAEYIYKDALVAEIERRTDELWALIPDGEKVIGDKHTKEDAFNLGKYTALESFGKFFNTLEAKEVDLQEEINNEWEKCNPIDEGMGVESAFIHIEAFDMIARHFFELGLKAKQG